MTRWSLGFLAFLSPVAFATEIRWSAQGTVSSVSAGFAAAVGDPVSVRFSYDPGATANVLTHLWFGSSTYAKTEFCGAIALTMEVTIGVNTWSARVPSSPAGGTFALLTEAWDGGGSPDIFTILASSADSGVFNPFPYTGSEPSRSVQVVLTDATVPTGFLAPTVLPTAATAVSEITSGSGFIAAGAARIDFTINPASVTVGSYEPAFALKLTKTSTGVELRWPTVIGPNYRLEEGDTLTDWQPYGTYPGTGGEIAITLNPLTEHPQRRFYRVVKE